MLQARLAQLVRKAQQVQPEHEEQPVLKGRKEPRDSLEQPAHKECKDFLVPPLT